MKQIVLPTSVVCQSVAIAFVSNQNGDFRKVLSQIDDHLQMDYSGSYKKTPAGFPTDGPDAAFCRLRNFGMWYYPDEEFLTAPHLIERLVEIYKTAKPFVAYINRDIDYSREEGL